MITFKYFSSIVLLSTLAVSQVFASGTSFTSNHKRSFQGWQMQIGVGIGGSIAGGQQTVALTNDIKGVYHKSGPTQVGLLSLGEDYYWSLTPRWQIGLGLAFNAIDYGQYQGVYYRYLAGSTVVPNAINYHYNAKSYALLGNVGVRWWQSAKTYFLLTTSFGSAWNTLSEYGEPYSTGLAKGFGNDTTRSFAYAAGVGAGALLNRHMALEFGYRYLNTGKAYLSAFSSTSGKLSSGRLSANTVFVRLLF